MQALADTTPGVGYRHSVTFIGHILGIKIAGNSWAYNVSNIHDTKSTLWVPEARVRLVSKSINDNCTLVYTRGVKKRLSVEREKNETLNKKYKELELDSEVLEEEIARLGRENSKLKAKTLDVTSQRDALVSELRGTTAESIFSKEVPEGRNAKEIQSRIARDIEKPLQSEIAVLQSKIAASKKKERALKIEKQELTSTHSQLKRENKERRAEIKSMLRIVDDSRIFAEERKDEDLLEENKKIIQTILTGVSSRQAAAQPSINRDKDYINRMRQRVGWMQEIVNATLLAGCSNIRQIGHDGGSISEVNTLCVYVIITKKITRIQGF